MASRVSQSFGSQQHLLRPQFSDKAFVLYATVRCAACTALRWLPCLKGPTCTNQHCQT